MPSTHKAVGVMNRDRSRAVPGTAPARGRHLTHLLVLSPRSQRNPRKESLTVRVTRDPRRPIAASVPLFTFFQLIRAPYPPGGCEAGRALPSGLLCPTPGRLPVPRTRRASSHGRPRKGVRISQHQVSCCHPQKPRLWFRQKYKHLWLLPPTDRAERASSSGWDENLVSLDQWVSGHELLWASKSQRKGLGNKGLCHL